MTRILFVVCILAFCISTVAQEKQPQKTIIPVPAKPIQVKPPVPTPAIPAPAVLTMKEKADWLAEYLPACKYLEEVYTATTMRGYMRFSTIRLRQKEVDQMVISTKMNPADKIHYNCFGGPYSSLNLSYQEVEWGNINILSMDNINDYPGKEVVRIKCQNSLPIDESKKGKKSSPKFDAPIYTLDFWKDGKWVLLRENIADIRFTRIRYDGVIEGTDVPRMISFEVRRVDPKKQLVISEDSVWISYPRTK